MAPSPRTPKPARHAAKATPKARKTAAPATTPDTKARRIGRAKDPTYSQIAVYIPNTLHRRLKMAAAGDGREMSSAIEIAIAAWVDAWARENGVNL